MKSLIVLLVFSLLPQSWAAPSRGVAVSDALAESFAREVAAIFPESGSERGLIEFDALATDWRNSPLERYEEFLLSWRDKTAALKAPKNLEPDMRVDVEILGRHVREQLDRIAADKKSVIFNRASEEIYVAINTLVNPQSARGRRTAAAARFRAIMQSNTISEWLKQAELKLADTSVGRLWPHRNLVKDYLENSDLLVNETEEKLRLAGDFDQELFAEYRRQIGEYDAFVRTRILPFARESNRLPKDVYRLNLRANGIDIEPELLTQKALSDYQQMLPKLQRLAHKIGKGLGLPEDGRAVPQVFAALRQQQVSGADKILSFTREMQLDLEKLIRTKNLMTLPGHRVAVRLGSEAENALCPFQHVDVPPPFGDHCLYPEYVFPIHADGRPYDEDCAYRAAALTLTAHEIFGHGVQFCFLSTHGNKMRAMLGLSNSAVEGWAMYVEHLLQSNYPAPERFGALQSILFRVARAFLEPMVQSGQAGEAFVIKTLVDELGIPSSFARGEFERYTWRSPGQAPSYYYGLKSLIEMRERVSADQGSKFDLKAFHDHIMKSGPMPLDLCEDLLTGSTAGSDQRNRPDHQK